MSDGVLIVVRSLFMLNIKKLKHRHLYVKNAFSLS